MTFDQVFPIAFAVVAIYLVLSAWLSWRINGFRRRAGYSGPIPYFPASLSENAAWLRGLWGGFSDRPHDLSTSLLLMLVRLTFLLSVGLLGWLLTLNWRGFFA